MVAGDNGAGGLVLRSGSLDLDLGLELGLELVHPKNGTGRGIECRSTGLQVGINAH